MAAGGLAWWRHVRGPVVLGVDAGTGGCKTVAYDLEGRPVAEAYREYPVIHPRVGWAEQNPEEWWRAAVETIREVVEAVGADSVEGLSVTSQREAFAPLDAEGRVLANSIIWLDMRAKRQEEWVREKLGASRVLEVTGLPVDQIFSAVKLLWLKEERPEVFSRTRLILFAKDYIIYRLTGAACTDYSMASRTMMLDIRRLEWSHELCEEMGIPLDMLPELRGSWEIVGEVSAEAAEVTGLRKGTPVAAGGGDRPCEALGSGTLREGEVNIGTGTGTCLEAPLSEPRPDPKARVDTCTHVVPRTWEYEVVINSTGESLRWFRDNFGWREVEEARERSASPYDVMLEEAAKVPPGSEGLMYYPYLWGAKTPFFNPDARGVFIGFTHAHTRAHFIRAVLEGVAYQYVGAMELLRDLGVEVRRVTMTGGEVRGRLWNEIKASVLGMRILVPRVISAASLGAAILAAVGAGLYRSFDEAVSSMVHVAEAYEPRPELHEKYVKLYKAYVETYRRLEDAFEIVARLSSG
ncbi:MAG: xylulokinase [Thermoprotei archaeon]|nr:MAG: xylulokinase [Thermoprotei archaeon]